MDLAALRDDCGADDAARGPRLTAGRAVRSPADSTRADELGVSAESAHAVAANPVVTAAPTPSATARPPTRATENDAILEAYRPAVSPTRLSPADLVFMHHRRYFWSVQSQKAPTMSTRYRTRAARPHSGLRTRRLLRPVAGQCFEIVLSVEPGRWLIRVPEINATAEAPTRAAVELAARECIAARTGIPIGYISVWVRD
jgi:hypothetical protein